MVVMMIMMIVSKLFENYTKFSYLGWTVTHCNKYARTETPTAGSMVIRVLWDDIVSTGKFAYFSDGIAAFIFEVQEVHSSCPAYTLQLEAGGSSETSVNIYQSTWHHVSKDFNMQELGGWWSCQKNNLWQSFEFFVGKLNHHFFFPECPRPGHTKECFFYVGGTWCLVLKK